MTVTSSTALIVVDAQNSFLHPDGGNFWPGAVSVVEPLQQLLDRARSAPVLIVHLADRHRADVRDAEFDRLPRHCVISEFDAEFTDGFGPAPDAAPGHEVVIEKRRYSGFFGTDLALVLHEHDITEIVLAGVKTNVCVRATATDALGHGLHVTVPREAVASNRPQLHDASVEDIDRYIGRVVDMATAVDALTQNP
ncbi:cysteine hydrolase [soil metagenome]